MEQGGVDDSRGDTRGVGLTMETVVRVRGIRRQGRGVRRKEEKTWGDTMFKIAGYSRRYI
jgi:hypothetical protein